MPFAPAFPWNDFCELPFILRRTLQTPFPLCGLPSAPGPGSPPSGHICFIDWTVSPLRAGPGLYCLDTHIIAHSMGHTVSPLRWVTGGRDTVESHLPITGSVFQLQLDSHCPHEVLLLGGPTGCCLVTSLCPSVLSSQLQSQPLGSRIPHYMSFIPSESHTSS